MPKTGIEVPNIPNTGVDTEQVKAHLEYYSETNKMNAAVREKWLEKLFSPSFLVFVVVVLIILSGFIFMSRDDSQVDSVFTYWKLILPVVTTYIGYAIGKGRSSGI